MKFISRPLLFTILFYTGCTGCTLFICGDYKEPKSVDWIVRAPTTAGDILVNHHITKSWSIFLDLGHASSSYIINPKYSYRLTFVDNGEIIEWRNNPEYGYPIILNKFDKVWYLVFYCRGNDSREIKFYVYSSNEWTEIEKSRFPKQIAMQNLHTSIDQQNGSFLSLLLYPKEQNTYKPEIYYDIFSEIFESWKKNPGMNHSPGILLFRFWDYLESSRNTLDWHKDIPIEESIRFKEKYID